MPKPQPTLYELEQRSDEVIRKAERAYKDLQRLMAETRRLIGESRETHRRVHAGATGFGRSSSRWEK